MNMLQSMREYLIKSMETEYIKGQRVYVVPADDRHEPFEAEVIKAGKVYITISNLRYAECRFSTIQNDSPFGMQNTTGRYSLYPSKECYEEIIAVREKCREILAYCSKHLCKLTIGQLNSLEIMLKNERGQK